MKKILVLSSSARKGGNSDSLADEFIRGAQESGHEVEKVMVDRLKMHGCLGCDTCKRKQDIHCVQKDDMLPLYDKFLGADVIVFASPVYYYAVNAQLKAVMDRTYGILAQLRDKTFYLIVSGASPKAGPYYDHIREEFRLYLDCFEGMKVGGVIIGENGLERGVMSEADKAEAYAAGKNA